MSRAPPPTIRRSTSRAHPIPRRSSRQPIASVEAGVQPSTPPASTEVEDAFADGWFHDSGAWLQIAIWGAALILIVVCIRMISRRFRHDSIGIAAGIIPFVICLYFFYQNINRLLPPGF